MLISWNFFSFRRKTFFYHGFTHDRENNKYDLNLKLNYGTQTIEYESNKIQLVYKKESDLVATADDIKYFETLKVGGDTKEILLKFIECCMVLINPERNDKLICRILKSGGMWGILIDYLNVLTKPYLWTI